MSELRWLLLVLGILVIVGVYAYSRYQKMARARLEEALRVEPTVDPALEGSGSVAADEAAVEENHSAEPVEEEAARSEPALEEEPLAQSPEKIIALRVAGRSGRKMGVAGLVESLRQCGLQHGQFEIFHKKSDGRTQYSVASLTEPGTFDLSQMEEAKVAGVSIFMVLPGPADPVASFDDMLATARKVATDLDGEVLDETGSSWSIQRERYMREEIIQFHHARAQTQIH